MPDHTHMVKYLWTELLEPNARGRFFHLAPLSRIQKMPRSAYRLPIAGLPPLGKTGASGTRSANHSNCCSVNRIAMQGYSRRNADRLRGLRIGSSLFIC